MQPSTESRDPYESGREPGALQLLDRRMFPEGPAYSNDYFLHGDTYNGLHTGGSE